MAIDRMHGLLAEISGRFHLDVLANRDVVDAAEASLAAHGKLGGRKMPLKSPLVFWLVIMLVLRRDRSVPNNFGALIGACRDLAGGLSRKAVTDGGLARARQRLGPEPFETFFENQTEARRAPWFHGLRPVAADGVRLTMPDTPANLARFPRQRSGRGKAAWPQMLAVCLLDIADRRIVGAAFDNIRTGERALGRTLWPRLDEDDLLIEDKGFFKREDLWRLDEAGQRFVCKLPGKPKYKVLRVYGPGDYLIEMRGRRPREAGEARDHRRGPRGDTKKFKLVVRLIAYKVNGIEHRIVTNVFDREIAPEDFAKIYHWRWDAEIAYDELKTHLMTVRHGQAKTVFRSKSPALVEQEFWAMLCAYNLVRGLMAEAGRIHGIDPLEISFTASLAVIEDSLIAIQRAADKELPRLHRRLLRDLAECRPDRPRRPRQWPRVVKAKMSNYRVKQEHHHESNLAFEVNLSAPERLAS